MVTNLKEGSRIKCQQYWPESGKEDFGPFQVTITDEQVFADYTIRTLSVTVRGYIYFTANTCMGIFNSLVQSVLTK